ncbi:hypothetical protein GYMLUDRAFT_250266 [Collybiopsis luxurians FD-317 M1]|uniref:Uncharacterized protein n=1 Tax=Collybiopsis luxurians FD-317 M1 TaxID=944289 RepID=A0A0D0C6U4_9AGAR|nr:hypothetical protein GYMLUDRAFT_250266 [Collybiopsis luxurians FD-317 M1]
MSLVGQWRKDSPSASPGLMACISLAQLKPLSILGYGLSDDGMFRGKKNKRPYDASALAPGLQFTSTTIVTAGPLYPLLLLRNHAFWYHLTQSGGLASPISSHKIGAFIITCLFQRSRFLLKPLVILRQVILRRRNMFDFSCLCIQHFYPEFNADPSTLLSSTIRALVVSAQYPPRLRYIHIIHEIPLILQRPFLSSAYSGIGRKSYLLNALFYRQSCAPCDPVFQALPPIDLDVG